MTPLRSGSLRLPGALFLPLPLALSRSRAPRLPGPLPLSVRRTGLLLLPRSRPLPLSLTLRRFLSLPLRLASGALRQLLTLPRLGALTVPRPLSLSGIAALPRVPALTLPQVPAVPGPLSLPLRQCRPLVLTLSLCLPRTMTLPRPLRQPRVLGPAGAALGRAGPALGLTGTDRARQRLADLELGPLGHLADLGHDVTALTHESVVDRQAVGGGGGGCHGGFPSWGDDYEGPASGPRGFSAVRAPWRYSPPRFVQGCESCPGAAKRTQSDLLPR
ncbi:hypothetical protein [Streptomyces sp. NPDC052092]|uniref:hypothetical protein n=1 Tax=Streptomyces sp. NPDC052092 TaxID=3365685 RepID=UPI0037D9883C